MNFEHGHFKAMKGLIQKEKIECDFAFQDM